MTAVDDIAAISDHVPLTDCFADRFVPLFDDNCPDCDDPAENFNCEVIYRGRYWGMVGGILMATEWGEI